MSTTTKEPRDKVLDIAQYQDFYLEGSDSELAIAASTQVFGEEVWWKNQIVDRAGMAALWYAFGRYDEAVTPGGVDAALRFGTHYKIVAAAYHSGLISSKPSILDYWTRFERARRKVVGDE